MKFSFQFVLDFLGGPDGTTGLSASRSLSLFNSPYDSDTEGTAASFKQTVAQVAETHAQGQGKSSEASDARSSRDENDTLHSENTTPLENTMTMLANHARVTDAYNMVLPNNTPGQLDSRFAKDLGDSLWIDGHQLSLDDILALQQATGDVPPAQWIQANPALTAQLQQQGGLNGNRLTTYRSLPGSQALKNALDYAWQHNKPVRFDFEGTALVLRLGKNGTVAADFIPNDKAAEQQVKQHLAELKERLESRGITQAQLSVRDYEENPHRQHQRQRQQTNQDT